VHCGPSRPSVRYTLLTLTVRLLELSESRGLDELESRTWYSVYLDIPVAT
jgi:hypothetical protein